jgi:hypothetical protein
MEMEMVVVAKRKRPRAQPQPQPQPRAQAKVTVRRRPTARKQCKHNGQIRRENSSSSTSTSRWPELGQCQQLQNQLHLHDGLKLLVVGGQWRQGPPRLPVLPLMRVLVRVAVDVGTRPPVRPTRCNSLELEQHLEAALAPPALALLLQHSAAAWAAWGA